MIRRFLYTTVALATWLALHPAPRTRAQEPAPTATPAPGPAGHTDARAKEVASAHFRRGVELFEEGAYRAALVEFEQANEVSPDYRLLYNIGQAKLALQDYLGATLSYERYLTLGGTQIAEARRDDVERQIEALRERVGRVAISVSAPNAEILIDDIKIGESPIDGTIPVNVGRHRVFARGQRGATDSDVFDVAGGELVNVSLELEVPEPIAAVAATSPQDRPMPLMRKAAIGTWIGAGLLAGGAVAFAVVAQSKADELEKNLDQVASSPSETDRLRSETEDLRSSADTFAICADVTAGLALAAGVTGIVLWTLGREETEPKPKDAAAPRAHVQWGVGPGSMLVRGAF